MWLITGCVSVPYASSVEIVLELKVRTNFSFLGVTLQTVYLPVLLEDGSLTLVSNFFVSLSCCYVSSHPYSSHCSSFQTSTIISVFTIMSGVIILADKFMSSGSESYSSVSSRVMCHRIHKYTHIVLRFSNLAFAHSGEESNQYADQSGMMGYSYGNDEGPKMVRRRRYHLVTLIHFIASSSLLNSNYLSTFISSVLMQPRAGKVAGMEKTGCVATRLWSST